MNYTTHNLRTQLQEWKNRLARASFEQLGSQLKYFFCEIRTNSQISSLLKEATDKYPLAQGTVDKITEGMRYRRGFSFGSAEEHAAFCYQFMERFFVEKDSYDIHYYPPFQYGQFAETKENIIDSYISPIVYFLHDKLDKSSAIVYLLEKYKRRTEWFTKTILAQQYLKATKNYEQIFEDDLRLFLFDQGIDYPFSTPSSTSGRADIIGQIDTNDPLVVEIKIFDRQKGYGKDRVKDGFSQIVKYANDYGKDVGYLVIFNMDKAELNLKFGSDNIFPPSIVYNHKNFYFVVINLFSQVSASKVGKLESIQVDEAEVVG